jgi:hypothetical protein
MGGKRVGGAQRVASRSRRGRGKAPSASVCEEHANGEAPFNHSTGTRVRDLSWYPPENLLRPEPDGATGTDRAAPSRAFASQRAGVSARSGSVPGAGRAPGATSIDTGRRGSIRIATVPSSARPMSVLKPLT